MWNLVNVGEGLVFHLFNSNYNKPAKDTKPNSNKTAVL